MKSIKKYKKVVIETTEVFGLFSDLLVVVNMENDKVIGSSIQKKSEVKLAEQFEPAKNKYSYYTDDTLKQIKSVYYTKIVPFTQDIFKVTNIKRENILINDGRSNLFYNVDGYPVSSIWEFDVITNLEYDLEKLKKHLEVKKEVLDIQIKNIPEYNARCENNKAMHLKLLFTQQDMNNFWDEVKDTKYPSVFLRDLIISSYSRKDPLGLKEFRYTNEIIEKKEEAFFKNRD